MNATDHHRDSYGSWALAVACLRERGVRSGQYEPRDEKERQQHAEGPREPAQLDAVLSP